MKSLIVGMGFGNAVYKPVLEDIGSAVITVDPIKPADFKTVEDAIKEHTYFDTVNICTPNFTHEDIARRVANNSSIVFVEKPGVKDSACWKKLVEDFPKTRFMMVKNNQYRSEIGYLKNLSNQSLDVSVIWNNKNRIPNPGSWFTTKDLAFGGVSRDLIPHMLSYYCVLANIESGIQTSCIAKQNHSLDSIADTDYGVVNKSGTYNVDDYCLINYTNNNTNWNLMADWKSGNDDDVYISFNMKNSALKYKLGLCPESAYKKMIETAVENLNNNAFWNDQLKQDIWIHEQIEKI